MNASTESAALSTLNHEQLHHRISTPMTRERRVTLRILDHLIEMDRRRLYRDRGHTSARTDHPNYCEAIETERPGSRSTRFPTSDGAPTIGEPHSKWM